MAKNLVRQSFNANGTWVCPAGVTRVKVIAYAVLKPQISCSQSQTIVTMNGIAYSCGLNTNGQLGIASVTAQSSPILVVGGYKWRQVANGPVHCAAVMQTGDAYAWGLNTSGQLGNGAVLPQSSPVLVLGGLKWREISAGDSNTTIGFTLGVSTAGAAYGWGNNANGNLGTGDVIPRSSPVAIVGGLTWMNISAGGNGHSLGVASTGAAYGWGINTNGQLGNGTVTTISSPVAVLGGLTFKQVSAGQSHSLGIASNGALYAWGNNANGQMGTGTVTPASSPIAVLGGLTWRKVVAGNGYSLGITTTGAAYAWGINTNGQLGNGADVLPRSSPVLIVGGLSWADLAASTNTITMCSGITNDGNAYAWGLNTNGNLGTGGIVTVSSPVLILQSALIWRGVNEAIVNEQTQEVVPGTSYPVTIFAALAQFNGRGIYSDYYNVGSLPIRITLEYFA